MVTVARTFLALTGAIYLYLSAWCSLEPAKTSELVGFTLNPGSGQSEFLVIYGGLELAMAILFLLPSIKPHATRSSLFACIVIHGCLVAFRSVSFFLYDDISTMTQKLAAGEWLIFLTSAAIYWKLPKD